MIAGCDSPESALCELTDPNGQTVTNTSVGTWPAEFSWPEVWRAGGLNEAEVFVRPAGVAVGPDGSVAIADWGLAEVIVLGPDGEWQGTVTAHGEGPGEVQAPVAVTWVDANTLLILDVSAFRLVTLDLASGSASATPVNPAFMSPVFAAGQVRFVALQPDRTVWLEFPGPIEDGWEERSFVRWSPDRPENDTVVWSRAWGFAGATLAAWPRSLLVGHTRSPIVQACAFMTTITPLVPSGGDSWPIHGKPSTSARPTVASPSLDFGALPCWMTTGWQLRRKRASR